jgi:hypothetical protein
MPYKPNLRPAVALLALLALAASPQPTGVVRTQRVVATVESVNQTTRQLLLRAPDGTHTTVVAGPAVRNLPQLKAGDKVTIAYQVAMAVQMAKAGSVPPNDSTSSVTRAAPGSATGGSLSDTIAERVTVNSAMPDGTRVTFTSSTGMRHTTDVRDPKMQAFVKGLKPGDQVDVDYAREVALSVTRGQ